MRLRWLAVLTLVLGTLWNTMTLSRAEQGQRLVLAIGPCAQLELVLLWSGPVGEEVSTAWVVLNDQQQWLVGETVEPGLVRFVFATGGPELAFVTEAGLMDGGAGKFWVESVSCAAPLDDRPSAKEGSDEQSGGVLPLNDEVPIEDPDPGDPPPGGGRPLPVCPTTITVRKLWDTSTCPPEGCPPLPQGPIQLRLYLIYRGNPMPEYDYILTCEPSQQDPFLWRCSPKPAFWIVAGDDQWFVTELTSTPGWTMGTPSEITTIPPGSIDFTPDQLDQNGFPIVDADLNLVNSDPWQEPTMTTFMTYSTGFDLMLTILNIRNVYDPSWTPPEDPEDPPGDDPEQPEEPGGDFPAQDGSPAGSEDVVVSVPEVTPSNKPAEQGGSTAPAKPVEAAPEVAMPAASGAEPPTQQTTDFADVRGVSAAAGEGRGVVGQLLPVTGRPLQSRWVWWLIVGGLVVASSAAILTRRWGSQALYRG